MANNLESIYSTSVKFYSSLTRNQALGKESIGKADDGSDLFVEPGAICFVSDSSGNSVFLNRRLFGDGAVASGTTGGGTGGGGSYITEVNLSDIVVIEKDGETLKTLQDYFNADGSIISENLIITGIDEVGNSYNAIEISSSGIKIGGLDVATQDWTNGLLSTLHTTISEEIATSELNAKNYAKGLISSVYKIKGTIPSLSDLYNLVSPEIGDVYNISSDLNGTNYVYTENGWDALGGSVSLENYYTKSDVDTKTSDVLVNAKTYTDTELDKVKNDVISPLSASIVTINGNLTTLGGNISTNTSNIAQNSLSITQISTQLTWQ